MSRSTSDGVPVRSRAGLFGKIASVTAAAACALAVSGIASAQDASTSAAGGGITTMSADLPPGCEQYAGAINSRQRIVKGDTYIHRMSDAPNCIPYGPINGTAFANSTFNVYYSDRRYPNWCYGYSVNAGVKGYVLCEQLRVP